MILRLDRVAIALPPPSDPDPDGAAAVQELMGGRFGEMSTLMNYTFQSFNFRGKQQARPFYDLVANIAAEEFGHIELVAMTINTMLTGVSDPKGGFPPEAVAAGYKAARIYRMSPSDYNELSAVFNGKHPENGKPLEVVDGPPDGVPPNDLPPDPNAFVPGYAPEEIAEIAEKLRVAAGLGKDPTGEVANP